MFGRLPPAVFAFLLFASGGKSLLRAQTLSGNTQGSAPAQERQVSRYEQAAAYYESVLAKGIKPTSAEIEVRTRLATAYFMLHRYADSLQALQPALRREAAGRNGTQAAKVPAQAWLVQGLDFLELNEPGEAIPGLRRALALNPKSGTARLALGDALARSGRLEEAGREYAKQTQLTPNIPEAWYKLGVVYAEGATRLVQKHDHQGVVSQQLAAEELLARSNNLDAARMLLPLARQYPRQPQLHADLGKALLEIGYAKAAEKQFRSELAFNPDCPLARFGLVETAALNGNWDDVFPRLEELANSNGRQLRQLFESPPPGTLCQAWRQGKIKIPEQYGSRAMATAWKAWLTSAGSTAVAFPEPHSAQRCSKLNSGAASTLGVWFSEACYAALGKKLRQRKIISAGERLKLAESDFRLGEYELARREAEQALASHPHNEWGAYWLSKAESALADECFVKVGELNPNSARVHQMLAQHYASWSEYPKAEAEFLAAIRLAPEMPDLHLGLGSVYWHRGDWPRAEAELKKTVELAPGSAQAEYELGDVYIQQQRWQEALQHLRKVPDDTPAGLSARLDRAKAEEELGQTRTALDDLVPALSQDKNGEIHYRVAGLYRKLGESEKAGQALKEFKRLRALAPQQTDVLEGLQDNNATAQTPTPQP